MDESAALHTALAESHHFAIACKATAELSYPTLRTRPLTTSRDITVGVAFKPDCAFAEKIASSLA